MAKKETIKAKRLTKKQLKVLRGGVGNLKKKAM